MSTLLNQGKIEHDWGFELAFASNKHYSGKILVFEKRGSKNSYVDSQDTQKELVR